KLHDHCRNRRNRRGGRSCPGHCVGAGGRRTRWRRTRGVRDTVGAGRGGGRGRGGGGGRHRGGVLRGRVVGARVVERGGGAGGGGRLPSITADASTAVFAALPSTAVPSTPTATIAAGSGIPAATATCAFGSVDRRSSADERRRSLRGVRRRHVCFVADAED